MTMIYGDLRALDYDVGHVVRIDPADTQAWHLRPAGDGLRVADVMTAPAPVIDPDAPLLEVVHRIVNCGDCELVVAVAGRPAGVVTARQILALLERDRADWLQHRAIDLVPSRTPRLLPDLRLADAARALSADRHDALPVVDFRGDVVGVLGLRHLVGPVAREGAP